MIYLVTNQKQLFDNLESKISFAEVTDVYKYFQNHKEIGVDTETTGFDPYTKDLLSLQLGDLHNQFVIDCTTVDVLHFKELLENPNITYIFQNAKFDLRFFYHKRIVIPKIFDTFLAESVLYTGIGAYRNRKSLDAIANKYLKVNLDKTVRGIIHREKLSNRVIIYAAEDVRYLGLIKEKQEEKLREQELEVAMALDNEFVKVLAYIEYCGIYLDRDKWKAKMEQDQINLNKAREELNTWVKENNLTKYIDPQLDLFEPGTKCKINWASSHQVIPLLKDLGIDTKIIDDKTGEYKDSCDAKVIKPQKDKSTLLPIYLKYKEYEKIVNTYGQTFLDQINPISGRIHTQFTQIMDTGRLSSGGKNKDFTGTKQQYVNLQNIPSNPETRKCFTAQKDHILINSDFSGQESVVFANWCMDKNILEFYKSGEGDMHSFIASKIFPELSHLSLKRIKSHHKDKRQIAKAAGFAIKNVAFIYIERKYNKFVALFGNKDEQELGEFRETPKQDNFEPSLSNSIKVDRKVQRLTSEELTNKLDTSAEQPNYDYNKIKLSIRLKT